MKGKGLNVEKVEALFVDSLPSEPDISMMFTSSFDFEGGGTYKAAQNQGAAFYEEGLDQFHGIQTKKMVSDAIEKF